jgi:hypothetical protein
MNLARTPDEVSALLEEWNSFQQCDILAVWMEPPARRLEIHTSNLAAGIADPNYPRRPGLIVIQGVLYYHSGCPILADGPAQVSSVEFREFTDFWSISIYFMGTYEHLTVFAKGPLSVEFEGPPGMA